MGDNWEKKRAENVVAGRVDLPEGKVDKLSDKQIEYYLGLRGAFRNALRSAGVLHADRIEKACINGVPSARQAFLDKSVAAEQTLMTFFDSLTPSQVMYMKIDSPIELLLCKMCGLAEVPA